MEQTPAVNFRVLHNENITADMCSGILLLFGLHGESTIWTQNRSCCLAEGEIYIISPLTLYRVQCSADAAALVMQLSETVLHKAGWTAATHIDQLLSNKMTDHAAHRSVRQHYAGLFRCFFQDAASPETIRRAVFLANELRQYFSQPAPEKQLASAADLSRINEVLHYVQLHWQEPLSITDLAGRYFLSESHLSRLFHRCTDMTFTEYLVSVRLEHVSRDLHDTSRSITQIAYENGFASANSMIDYFRRKYGMTPGAYRKNIRKTAEKAPHSAKNEGLSDWLQVLLQYDTENNRVDKSVQRFTAQVQADRAGEPLRRSWRLMNIGYARDGLTAAVQEQIRRAKQEIGFTDLRFHGIFDDDMHIYQQNEDGSPWFNFTYADMLFDFILSVGLTPYVELGFMPSQLAQIPYRLFERNSIMSVCTDWEKWKALVQASVAHWIERYGLREVLRWRFAPYSYNFAQLSHTPLDEQDYLTMYCDTWHVLKELHSDLQFGGPGCFIGAMLDENSGKGILRKLTEAGCPPDFLSAVCYPHENIIEDSEFLHFTIRQSASPSILSKDEDFMLHSLQQMHYMMDELELSDREIVIEECNSTLWQRDLSGDTCYKAAWLFKNALECNGQATQIGYWLLTDFIEEWLVPGGVFHGGYGLFTANGIPKAGYQAMKLLTKAGTEKLASGPGWFVSRRDEDIQIFCYHYCHYDALYRYRYQKLTDPQEAYNVFKPEGEWELTLTLSGVPVGEYRMERHKLTRNAGSAYDKWLSIGATASLRPEDIRYLQEAVQPAYAISDCTTSGEIQVQSRLQPHEVEVVLLCRKDR